MEGFSSPLVTDMLASGIEATFSATFGNLGFVLRPSVTGEVSNSFGTVNYIPLEQLIFQQANTAQMSPVNVLSGQSSGQQNIQGQYTIQDNNGLTRMVMGYSPGGF